MSYEVEADSEALAYDVAADNVGCFDIEVVKEDSGGERLISEIAAKALFGPSWGLLERDAMCNRDLATFCLLGVAPGAEGPKLLDKAKENEAVLMMVIDEKNGEK